MRSNDRLELRGCFFELLNCISTVDLGNLSLRKLLATEGTAHIDSLLGAMALLKTVTITWHLALTDHYEVFLKWANPGLCLD